MVDAVGPDEMVELLEIERERRAELVRRSLGHQHRFAFERRGHLDDEPFAGVMGGAQEDERVCRIGQRGSVDDEALRVGPRRGHVATRLDDHMASEFVGPCTGGRHATRHVATRCGDGRCSAPRRSRRALGARRRFRRHGGSPPSSNGSASSPDVGTS